MRREQAGHGAVAGVDSLRRHGWLNRLASPSSKAGCLARFSRGTMSRLLPAPPYAKAQWMVKFNSAALKLLLCRYHILTVDKFKE